MRGLQERRALATRLTDPEAPPWGRRLPVWRPRAGRPPVVAGAVAATVLALDQASKQWALGALADGPIELVGSLRLRLSFNSGASFGIGQGRAPLFAVAAAVGVVVLLVLAWRAASVGSAVGLGMVLGGAAGNLADRLFRSHDGAVVDWVDLQWWPLFNLADVGLVTGVLLLLVLQWRSPPPVTREPDRVVNP